MFYYRQIVSVNKVFHISHTECYLKDRRCKNADVLWNKKLSVLDLSSRFAKKCNVRIFDDRAKKILQKCTDDMLSNGVWFRRLFGGSLITKISGNYTRLFYSNVTWNAFTTPHDNSKILNKISICKYEKFSYTAFIFRRNVVQILWIIFDRYL